MSLSDLEEYFKTAELPEDIQLNSFTYVEDVEKLVKSNIGYLKAHPGNKSYMPYYRQLVELKRKLEENESK